jgi:hypothetical protein
MTDAELTQLNLHVSLSSLTGVRISEGEPQWTAFDPAHVQKLGRVLATERIPAADGLL